MTNAVVDFWADGIVRARQRSASFAPTGPKPTELADAYYIQSAVAAQMGAVGGFKTARKGDAPPIMAPIFAADIVPSGADVAVVGLLGIELEVGFEIIGDCPANMASLGVSDLAQLLRPVAVIELVDTRVTGPSADDQIVKLADNQINAGLVVGAFAPDWDGSDFGTLQARMQAGDDVILDGQATVPGGSALETFAALNRQIGDHCGGFKRGQIVITGSLHPLVYYPAGTKVAGWIEGIGTVSVNLL